MTTELDDATRCTHEGCDSRGTHRLVIVLKAHGEALVKKYLWADSKGRAVRRCLAHQEKDPTVFVSDETWNRLAENFARAGFAQNEQIPIADRSKTRAFYVDDVTKIDLVPVLVPVSGRLEEVGKARILS